MSNFINRLREERVRLGLTQEEFGALGGVSRGVVSLYELGKCSVPGTFLADIAPHGADVGYIITGVRAQPSQPATVPPDEAAMLELYRQADESGKDAMMTVGFALQKKATTTYTVRRKAG